MNLFVKILWAVVFIGVGILGWMLLAEQKRANYLENFIRTQKARDARWNGKDEPKLEEQKIEEPLNQNSND